LELEVRSMRKHYDFGKMKGEKNPYIKALKQPITMRWSTTIISSHRRQLHLPMV